MTFNSYGNRLVKSAAKSVVLFLVTIASANISTAQAEFRWIDRKADAQLFNRIAAAFSEELKPDVPGTTGNVLPMTAKSLARIGLYGNAALVMVKYEEREYDPYPIFRAFTFHLGSGKKALTSSKDAEWLSLWKFVRIAHFEDDRTPDVVFRFFSCTECEAEQLLASFRYDAPSDSWKVRHWSTEDGDDLMIGSDRQFGDDGDEYFDCLYTVRDLNGDGRDDVAVRCRERVDDGKTIKVTKDETLLYTMKSGGFRRVALGRSYPMKTSVESALCEAAAKSPLCPKR